MTRRTLEDLWNNLDSGGGLRQTTWGAWSDNLAGISCAVAVVWERMSPGEAVIDLD